VSGRRVLVTRPQPAAARTAERLMAMGLEPVLRPLMETQSLDWERPDALPEAVLLSSAAAARHAAEGAGAGAGAGAAALMRLPARCVGAATEAAARAAGFSMAEQAGADLAEALATAAARGTGRMLHLAGEDRTMAAVPDGLELMVVTVYRAVLLPLVDPGEIEAVLLYSARSARHFASEWDRLGRQRSLLVAGLSRAVVTAAGPGWAETTVAATPDELALLAALAATGL
jgi:uroporphyrinogen-III synthase